MYDESRHSDCKKFQIPLSWNRRTRVWQTVNLAKLEWMETEEERKEIRGNFKFTSRRDAEGWRPLLSIHQHFLCERTHVTWRGKNLHEQPVESPTHGTNLRVELLSFIASENYRKVIELTLTRGSVAAARCDELIKVCAVIDGLELNCLSKSNRPSLFLVSCNSFQLVSTIRKVYAYEKLSKIQRTEQTENLTHCGRARLLVFK